MRDYLFHMKLYNVKIYALASTLHATNVFQKYYLSTFNISTKGDTIRAKKKSRLNEVLIYTTRIANCLHKLKTIAGLELRIRVRMCSWVFKYFWNYKKYIVTCYEEFMKK